MKSKKEYIFYDELNDEFSGIVRDKITIDKNYIYRHEDLLWKVGSFFLYRLIMTPIAYCYLKFVFHIQFVNRGVINKYGENGFFLYGNHTQVPGDGFIPTILTFPKRDYVIVNADNVSLKGSKTFMEMIGAYPIPTTIGGMKNFIQGLKGHCADNRGIVIYPEAHIWPYYTDIRPFTYSSFTYPVMMKKPVFCFTVTYQKMRWLHKSKITVYVDGPFEPDTVLTKKQAQSALHKEVFQCMKERCKNSTYQYVKYMKGNREDVGNDKSTLLRKCKSI